MKSLSRLASWGEAASGLIAAALFWLVDACLDKFLFGDAQPWLDILIHPDPHEFRTRLLATVVILFLVFVATVLLRHKENSEAQLQHGRFMLEEVTIELSHKNDKLREEISRRKAVEARLEQLADTDQLTSIYNRRKFDEMLNLELRQEARYGRGLCLAMLDIDHFKDVNDLYGHAAGNAVLKELAQMIENNRREADSFFRIGGEEFCLITFASNGANLETACEKIRKAVAEYHFDKAGHLTISIGASQYQPGDSYDALFKRADTALYKAKLTGRNRVVVG